MGISFMVEDVIESCGMSVLVMMLDERSLDVR
jgi:hypothetical protein